jgi:3-hydroxymyristoyl/3-hydroxydecanoyl-(acyl carrier protein) dehydratase
MASAIQSPTIATGKFALDDRSLRLVMPHRQSMVLLDGVTECWLGERRVVGFKKVALNDPILAGHFPDWPVFPPSLLIEAMAQAAGCLMNLLYLVDRGVTIEQLCNPEHLATAPLPGLSVLAESRVKRSGHAFAGDLIVLEASVLFRRNDLSAFNVRAVVNGSEIAKGEMILGYPPYVPTLHEVARSKEK